MAVKNHEIIETEPVQYPDRDQSKVPEGLRSVKQLIRHKRSKRVGEKCDIGKPGIPHGWWEGG